MKTLTKPEQFRMASLSIYGYEGEWIVWTEEDNCGITTYYECVESTVFDCEPGDFYSEYQPKHGG